MGDLKQWTWGGDFDLVVVVAHDRRPEDVGKPPVVLVRPFDVDDMVENSEKVSSALTKSFCESFGPSNKFALKCFDDVAQVVGLKQMMDSEGTCGKECMKKVTEAIKPSKVLRTSLSKVRKGWMVKVELLDGRTGQKELETSIEVKSSKMEKLLPVVKGLADRIATVL